MNTKNTNTNKNTYSIYVLTNVINIRLIGWQHATGTLRVIDRLGIGNEYFDPHHRIFDSIIENDVCNNNFQLQVLTVQKELHPKVAQNFLDKGIQSVPKGQQRTLEVIDLAC